MSSPAGDGTTPGTTAGDGSARDVRRGVLAGTGAYLLWGAFPLYFPLMKPAGALEVLAHRVLWSALVCVVVVTLLRRWPAIRAVTRTRAALMLPLAAVLIGVNWLVYIYAVNSAQVVQAALGYYVNPIVTVLLGVVVLRERLRPTQWAAVGVGLLAVVVLTVDYGRPPWTALVLAASFGGYGLLKNRVGRGVDALTSLSVETGVLAPVALVVVVVLQTSGAGTFTSEGVAHPLLLASTGVATAVPLLLFAAAARRVPLSTLGLMQYLTPTLQLIIGVAVQGEPMTAGRWAGFALVWVALALLTADVGLASRRTRADARAVPV